MTTISVCGNRQDIYYRLIEECNPDRYFKDIEEYMIPSIEEHDPELADEVRGWVNCTSSWLKRYIKFASGRMSDHELYKFYNDTLKMFDTGIEARKYQMSLVDEELARADEYHANEIITDEEYEDILRASEEVKEALESEIEIIKQLRDECMKATDKLGVVTCIERVATTAHHRGAMLPVLCGAYLHEDIIEAITGKEEWYEFTRPEDVGWELSRDTMSVLDCIKEFR